MKKTFPFFALILIMLVLILSGCEEAVKAPAKNEDEQTSESAKSNNKAAGESTSTLKNNEDVAKLSLKLYYADGQSEKLVKEVHLVDSTNEVAKASLERLISGPINTGHLATIPKGTRLLAVSIRDNIASVDFSEEFVKNHTGGSSGEVMTVFSVVNTLTEFPSIKSVRFLVAGKKIDTIAGHYDLSEPVGRNESLIAPQ